MTPDVSILIVNFNGAAFIRDCLAAVFASKTDLTYEIILLDNASQDDSAQIIAGYEPDPRVICLYNKTNTGFPTGVNQALAHATGAYTLLLNSDAFLHASTLYSLYQCCQAPSIGVVAPKLLNPDKSLQVPGSNTIVTRRIYGTDRPRAVSFVSGAVMMLNTAYFRSLGGLDTNFFFYNDDIDLCWRIRKDKKQVYYLATATATHYIGASSKTIQPKIIIESYRSGLWLIKKHYPRLYLLYKTGLILVLKAKLIYCSEDDRAVFKKALQVVSSC